MTVNTVEQGIQYANDILDGKIISNKYIKFACKKFLNKLLDDDKSKYIFDKKRAKKILTFFNKYIKHTKGDIARKPYILSPWEVWILINIFGFVHKEDKKIRQYKNAIIFVGRKNSKSTLSAGIALYHLIADDEVGAEVYGVATQKDQSKIVWLNARAMINLMPENIKRMFQQTVSQVRVDELNSFFKPLGRESKGLDGLNVSLALFDESASIVDRNMHEVITSSQGSRKQYLNIHITTSQVNKATVFYENYEYCKNILKGDIDDPTWFSAIYELEPEDNWDDATKWIKANPNLGISVHQDFLEREMSLAKEIPSKKSNFLVKHLNRWTSSASAWLPIDIWERNIVPEIKTDGELWVGVDLGATYDLTALVFLYRDKSKRHYYMDFKCFLPEKIYHHLPSRFKYIYEIGLKEGNLLLTEGNATNFNKIKDYLVNYIQDKNLIEIAFDPWSGKSFSTELAEDGYQIIAVPQSMANLSPATKETEIHARNGEIKQVKSRFLEWQYNNCHMYVDVNNNIKIRIGEDRTQKIDTVIALLLAMNRASANGGLAPKKEFNIHFFTPNSNLNNKESYELNQSGI